MRLSVFIIGGTGYIENPLERLLSERGHHVRALVRPGSEQRLSANSCEPVLGSALDPSSYAAHIRPAETFVQLLSEIAQMNATIVRPWYLRSPGHR